MVAFLPDQDETVYNYAQPEPVIEPKPPRYAIIFTKKMLCGKNKQYVLFNK